MVRLLLPSAATCVVEVIDTETEVQRHREVQRERKAFPFRLGPSNMPEQNGEVPPPH